MADNKTPIRDINGHTVVDQEARDQAAQNAERIGKLSEEIANMGGGSSVQPDWNQNDPNAADYVKNRTHYVGEKTQREFLAEGVYAFEEQNGMMRCALPFDKIESGNTYVVTLDGTEYVCNAKPLNDGYMYIGNDVAVNGDDTGEPFVIVYEGVGYCFMLHDPATQHTISIVEQYEPVVTLPEKYLPIDAIIEAVNKVLKITHVQLTSRENGTGPYYPLEWSFEEIDRACMDGLVVGHLMGRTYNATRNSRNGVWYIDFYRYGYDVNKAKNFLSVISVGEDGTISDALYSLSQV